MAILVLQIGVSFAVIKYFRQRNALPVSIWSRLIAPIISALGMLVILYVVIANLEMLSGSSSPVVLFFTLATAGLYGHWHDHSPCVETYQSTKI